MTDRRRLLVTSLESIMRWTEELSGSNPIELFSMSSKQDFEIQRLRALKLLRRLGFRDVSSNIESLDFENHPVTSIDEFAGTLKRCLSMCDLDSQENEAQTADPREAAREKQGELGSVERAAAITGSLKVSVGTTWKDIEIRFLDDHTVQVLVAGQPSSVCNFVELGFADRRGDRGKRPKLKPNRAWTLLKVLAQAGPDGVHLESVSEVDRPAIEKRVQEIRRALKEVFGLTEDPFEDFRSERRYRMKLRISSIIQLA